LSGQNAFGLQFGDGLMGRLTAAECDLLRQGRRDRSNGQVEGQINRLKMVKRQMFSRANLDLLKARVLKAA